MGDCAPDHRATLHDGIPSIDTIPMTSTTAPSEDPTPSIVDELVTHLVPPRYEMMIYCLGDPTPHS